MSAKCVVGRSGVVAAEDVPRAAVCAGRHGLRSLHRYGGGSILPRFLLPRGGRGLLTSQIPDVVKWNRSSRTCCEAAVNSGTLLFPSRESASVFRNPASPMGTVRKAPSRERRVYPANGPSAAGSALPESEASMD